MPRGFCVSVEREHDRVFGEVVPIAILEIPERVGIAAAGIVDAADIIIANGNAGGLLIHEHGEHVRNVNLCRFRRDRAIGGNIGRFRGNFIRGLDRLPEIDDLV